MTPAQQDAVRRIVDQAPPITEDQLAQLRGAGLRSRRAQASGEAA